MARHPLCTFSAGRVTSVFVANSMNRYAMTSTVKVCSIRTLFQDVRNADGPQRLLDHLKEAGFYSAKDLDGIEDTFTSMRETIERGKETYSPHLLTLLKNRLDTCHMTLEGLKASLATLSPELVPTHEKLISILRSMAAANTRQHVRYLLSLSLQSISDDAFSFLLQRFEHFRTS